MQDEQTVIARHDGRVGRIVLNRPKALNALDLRDDPGLHAGADGVARRPACARAW